MHREVQTQKGYPLLGVLRYTDDGVRIPLDDEVEPIVSVYPPPARCRGAHRTFLREVKDGGDRWLKEKVAFLCVFGAPAKVIGIRCQRSSGSQFS